MKRKTANEHGLIKAAAATKDLNASKVTTIKITDVDIFLATDGGEVRVEISALPEKVWAAYSTPPPPKKTRKKTKKRVLAIKNTTRTN